MLFERSVIIAIIRPTPVKVPAIDIGTVNVINEHVCHKHILTERENLFAFLCKVPKLHINLGTFPAGRLGNSFVSIASLDLLKCFLSYQRRRGFRKCVYNFMEIKVSDNYYLAPKWFAFVTKTIKRSGSKKNLVNLILRFLLHKSNL